jgi:hypothetical protein
MEGACPEPTSAMGAILMILLCKWSPRSSTSLLKIRFNPVMNSRYDVAKGSNSAVSSPSITDGCHVIHLNLVVKSVFLHVNAILHTNVCEFDHFM